MTQTASTKFLQILRPTLLWAAALLILSVLGWQAITVGGNPDPLASAAKKSPTAATLDIGVLVFREGLECILVLSAITASMVGSAQRQRRPVAVGAGAAFIATIVTWFAVVGIVSDLTESFPALQVQAATGLLAVIVLLVVMNWFFHKIYWSGWIGLHNRRKRSLLQKADGPEPSRRALLWGLGLLGFSSLYREGFEVVLFLQSYMLKLGGAVVFRGVLIGLFLTGIVAVLTFIADQRLPYRRMMVLTGVMLGVVLLVMVGEQAQEMQLAHWVPTTPIPVLEKILPAWLGLWFGVSPTVETLVAQAIAGLLVVGSYLVAKIPASKQQCEADCAVDADELSPVAEPAQCDPLCVSATVCRTKRDLKTRE